MRIPVYMEVSMKSGIIELSHAKTGTRIMQMRAETGSMGTIDRLDPSGRYDSDNFWILAKPADNAVFEDGLFDPKKKLTIKRFSFELNK